MSAGQAAGLDPVRIELGHDGWAIMAQPPGSRDLGSLDIWERSLERSQRRREAAANRRRVAQRGTVVKVSAALAVATVAAPAGQMAAASASTSAPSGGMLRLGSRGASVAAVQHALGLNADGVFGPATKAAVLRYQSAHGLEVDGIVGPITSGALGLGGASASAASNGGGPKPSHALTMEIQRKLGVNVDGGYGPITRAAVRAFQAAHGLTVDGVVGPQTLSALNLGGSGARSSSTSSSGEVSGPKPSHEVTMEIQRKLGLNVDGGYGPITRNAVRQFQAAHGLTVDGVVGPQTLSAMGLSGASGSSSSGTTTASQSSGVAAAVAAARSKIGTPYVTAGVGPSGFDCSGLTMWAFQQAGIALPRTSYAQYGVGTPVSHANVQAGDLVFFSTDGAGASHVGIATSATTAISATTHGVMEHSTVDSYWGAHYLGARRV